MQYKMITCSDILEFYYDEFRQYLNICTEYSYSAYNIPSNFS